MPTKWIKTFITVMVVIIAFILITAKFDLRLDRFGSAKILWVDCVQINNTKYFSYSTRRIVEASEIGNKIGEVTFRVAGRVGNPKYCLRNGDATFLDIGTEIFNINKADKADKAVAVKLGEHFYLYTIEE